jgi:hypothetical protein
MEKKRHDGMTGTTRPGMRIPPRDGTDPLREDLRSRSSGNGGRITRHQP